MSILDPRSERARFGTEAFLWKLFDPGWYAAQRFDAPTSSVSDAFEHFVSIGRWRGASPSPLFDGAHYVSQAGGEAIQDPIGHYLDHGIRKGFDPHPLISTLEYRERAAAPNEADVLAFAADIADAPPLHPLFDRTWYERRRARRFCSGLRAFADFVGVGQGLGIGPNPFFDPGYFNHAARLPPSDLFPFETYWRFPERRSANVHPLFSGDTAERLLGSASSNAHRSTPIKLGPLLGAGELALPVGALEACLTDLQLDGAKVWSAEEALEVVLHNRAPRLSGETWHDSALLKSRAALNAVRAEEFRSAPLAFRKSKDWLFWGPQRIGALVMDQLAAVATLPRAGVVGLTRGDGPMDGHYRAVDTPSGPFAAISEKAMSDLLGIDAGFATMGAAIADLALRAAQRGYRNFELSTAHLEIYDAPNIVDAVLLFDRHQAVLKTFDRATELARGTPV